MQVGEVKILASSGVAGAIGLDWTVLGGSAPGYAIQYGLLRDDLK